MDDIHLSFVPGLSPQPSRPTREQLLQMQDSLLPCPLPTCGAKGMLKHGMGHGTHYDVVVGCTDRRCPMWRFENCLEYEVWQALPRQEKQRTKP